MKTKLIILMAVLMLFVNLSAFSVSYSDISGNEYENDINILTVLGIAESFYEDEFLPDKPMSRADYCRMLIDIVGEVSSNKGYYKDVSSEHKAFNQISYAYTQNIMIGCGNGYFKPDEPIKFGEAVKVMISFMGYDFKTDGSIISAVQLGKQLGILKNLPFSYTEELTRGMACRLIKNSLDIPIPELSSVGDGETYKIGSMTLLKKYKKMDMDKGIVNSNEFLSLKGRPLSIKNCISINGENFRIRNLTDIELVGMEVEYIYRIVEDNIPELVYVKTVDENVLVVDRDDYFSFKDNVFSYLEGEKEREIKLSPEADFFYNGEPITFSKDIFEKVKYGIFRFVETEKDKNFDAVFIEEYKNYVAGNIKADEKKVRDYYNPSEFVVFDDEVRTVLLYDKENNPLEFKDIQSGQVISVAENKNFIKAYICRDSFTGILNVKDEDSITIDDNDYELSHYADTQVAQLSIGTIYIWYTDVLGKIHCWQIPDETENEYVYIIKIADGVEFESGVVLKGYHIKNGVNTYTLSENVIVDGVERKNLNASRLTELIGTDETIIENGVEKIVKNVNQLIIAEFNSDGELHRINTARPLAEVDDNYNGMVLLADGSESLMYMGEDPVAKSFAFRIFFTPNTPVIMTPDDIENGADDEYETSVPSRFSTFSSYPILAYAKNPQSEYADIIVSESVGKAVGDNSRMAVISGFSKVLDEEGNVVGKVTTVTQNKEQSVLYNNDFRYSVSFNGELYGIDDLEKGDIWLYGTDAKGKLSSFKLIYDASANVFIPPYAIDNYRLSSRIIMGEITKITPGFYAIKQPDGLEIKVPLRDFLGCTVVEKSASGLVVRNGVADDADPEDAIFVQYSSRVPYDIVIFKK